MQSINPATEEIIGHFEAHSPKDAVHIIEQAHSAFLDWRKTDFAARTTLLNNVAKTLERNKERYAELMANEMGKVVKEGISEVEKCASVCRYYAEHGAKFLADETIQLDSGESFITYQPLGVILAIMPWNFPFWQVFRFAAPTIMAGNSAILKHASNVCGCALEIEEIFNTSGAPEHLFNSILIKGANTKQLIQHPLVQAVTLTGSTEAGKSVAKTAGETLKKSVLELGGSDPYIILEDADIEQAAKLCVQSRMLNAGQSCIAAKRMIVVDKIYDTFLDSFTTEMKKITAGNPLEDGINIGPQATIELRDQLHQQVEASIKAGAKCTLGGTIPSGVGAFYPPTILVNVDKNCPAYSQEMFGPVATVIRAKDEADAIRIANDTSFGLGSAIFTQNTEHGKKLAKEQLHAGACFVNDFVKSDPRIPFGGIKESGYGRELSKHGIREFVNVKSIHIA